MRGGALALLCWATLLALTGTLNAIWTGDAIQIGTFAAAVSAILLLAGALTLRSPEAVRRGPPSPPRAAEPIPRASFASALIPVGLAVLVFGLAFGHFPVYLGAGMIVAGLARLALELAAQRRAGRAASTQQTTHGERR